jgi:hypothetical protein
MKLTIPLKPILTFFLTAGGLILAACSSQLPTPTSIPTAQPTETATATIIWFPATNTPTLFPTQAPVPTQDFQPGLGDVIFTDSFDQPKLWDTASSAQASAAVTRNRLILSISEPGPLTITSLRSQPVMGDFYAEAMVNLSLCSGKDQYGFLFRATPGGNYYRVSINCSGQLRMERVSAGVTYPLLDWLSSGDAPAGAPAEVKLGVWADGRETRIFLNDQYQVSVTDQIFSSGTLGFFAYADGQTPVTVSFSNLSVYPVSYLLPTITPIPSWTPTLTPNP